MPKTRYEVFTSSLNRGDAEQFQAWLARLSPELRVLALEFPPGTRLVHDGHPAFLVSIHQSDAGEVSLWLSRIDPMRDRQTAKRTAFLVTLETVRHHNPPE